MAVLSGRYQQHTLDLPAGVLKAGENTIALELSDHNYATSGIAGIMWDCIKLEMDEATETYDFTAFEGNPVNQDDSHYATGTNLYLLAVADNNFNNRFAIGPNSRTGNQGFFFRKANATYKGLYSQHADRNFSILNLEKGDRVTLTLSNNVETLKFVGGDAVISGKTYTVEADGNLDFVTTGSVYIEDITISKEEQNIGGATLVSENALDFTDVTEIEAYVATAASAGTVTFNRVYKVDAGTPLYLKADAAVSVDVPVLDGDPETISTNLLKGSATNTTDLRSTDDTKYYVFGVLDDEAGFYPVSTTGTLTSAAGKAYLELTVSQASSARSIRMVFDDVTGINTVKENEGNETGDNIWYTLQGARVAKPTHGIYIRNGKKIFIK